MPLVAFTGDTRHLSTELTAAAWDDLRRTYRQRNLQMTCGQPAIPKTSVNGLRFFAHKPGADCGLHLSGPETAEHLASKIALAVAAVKAGWTATIEAISADRTWIADVLIERRTTRVALEAQWSPQTETTFSERTQRYADAGVECVWFLGPKNHERSVDRSYLIRGTKDELTIMVPGVPGVGLESVPLTSGAHRLLNSEIRRVVNVRTTGLVVAYVALNCWRNACGAHYSRWWLDGLEGETRCGKAVRLDLVRTGHGVTLSSGGHPFPSAGAVGEKARGARWGEFAANRPEDDMPAEFRRALSLTLIPSPCSYGFRTPKELPAGYVAALCPRCGALQGDSFFEGHVFASSPKKITVRWTAEVTIPEITHWCKDTGHGRCAPTRSHLPFPAAHQTMAMQGTSHEQG